MVRKGKQGKLTKRKMGSKVGTVRFNGIGNPGGVCVEHPNSPLYRWAEVSDWIYIGGNPFVIHFTIRPL